MTWHGPMNMATPNMSTCTPNMATASMPATTSPVPPTQVAAPLSPSIPNMATPSMPTTAPSVSVRCTRARSYPRLTAVKKNKSKKPASVQKQSFSLLDDFECPKCNIEVKDGEEALECDKCFKWRHKRCTNVSDEQYNHIDATGAEWVCTECSPKVKDCSSNKSVLNCGDNGATEIECVISSSKNNLKDNDIIDLIAPTQIRVCPVCQCHVTKGILCPGDCVTWLHVKCAGFTQSEAKLVKSGDRTWKCKFCKLKDPLDQDNAKCIIDDCTTWGDYSGADLVNVVNNVYREAVQWKINLFMLPSGEAGEMFISEVTKLIVMFNTGSKYEPIALTMLMMMFPLLLQKPSPKSNVRTHISYLQKRLVWWKEGKVQLLLDECRAIQDRLLKSKGTPQDNTKAFTRLMLHARESICCSQVYWEPADWSSPGN